MNSVLRWCSVFAMLWAGVRCSNDSPVDPGGPTTWFSTSVEVAWELLDVYLVFRDRLPAEPMRYQDPAALYAAADEPWTRYYTHSEAVALYAALSPNRVGMGVLLDSVCRGLLVRQVYEGSPAEAAGVLRGDTILSVNDSVCAGRSFDVCAGWIRGDEGETRALRLLRSDQHRIVTVTLGAYQAPTVFADSLDSAIAYIAITGFFNATVVIGGTSSELHAALMATDWAEQTIIDLRGNGGGHMSQALRICGEFVPLGTPIVAGAHRESVTEVQGADTSVYGVTVDTVWRTQVEGVAGTRQCVVLVDNRTASASEVLLACLRDQRGDDITVIGETTYGKGRAQVLVGYDARSDDYFLADSGVARITYSVVFPVVGAPYDSVGIDPDIAVEPGQDALDVALRFIRMGTEATAAKLADDREHRSSLMRAQDQLARGLAEPGLFCEHNRMD